MRITESKLRSIIREVIKEAHAGRNHDDRQDRGWAPDDRVYAGEDLEAGPYVDSDGNIYQLWQLGYEERDGLVYDKDDNEIGYMGNGKMRDGKMREKGIAYDTWGEVIGRKDDL